ncbi:hypothetical protein PV664_13170 [Streptomyces sp. ME01-18a]|uniref:hypothetical protein n=1 Tax=unclassified Streptomyces TaxID=2593676 RepID=UPI0029A116CC|nr:hypothetical protein [Streptomyces sp. ME01-18a]MDX3429887.1 hypothetical protein [Streptomyces sp. ME01-18a]
MSDDAGPAGRLRDGVPLREAVGTASPADWVRLDAEVRTPAWRTANRLPTREELRGLPAGPLSDAAESRVALALCHPDGRVREAALARVTGAPGLRPLLVVRCADWVTPVRDRARALLGETAGPQLAPLAPLILLLSRRDRGGFALRLLEGALRQGAARNVEALLADEDRAVRRLAYRIAVDRQLLTPAELARTAATASGDTSVQTLCADAALAGAGEDDYDAVVAPLLASRSPQVRSAGVTGLRRTGRHREAIAFLADRSALVRACARYVVRQGGTDPLPLYRSMCADPTRHPAAAAGLGECGSRADVDTLWHLTGHQLPAVRAHAVSALCTLDAVRPDRLRPLLDDLSAVVVRAAARALQPHAATLDTDLLRAGLAPDRARPTRIAARRLLEAQERALARGARPGP